MPKDTRQHTNPWRAGSRRWPLSHSSGKARAYYAKSAWYHGTISNWMGSLLDLAHTRYFLRYFLVLKVKVKGTTVSPYPDKN